MPDNAQNTASNIASNIASNNASNSAPNNELNNAPIGVFDSGIGGLTVVRALTHALPNESLIYFGDTARVPYGPKSPETVRRYAAQIVEWLVSQGVKAVVIACNTATAHALDTLRTSLTIPVIGVVDPGARAAVARTRTGSVGVIGTAGTIASGAYERAIIACDNRVRVTQQACPLFVPLVEEGWTEHAAARLIAAEYLAPLTTAQVDTVVLGCTHYPLLKDVISGALGAAVQLVDSADETAAETVRVVKEQGIAAAPHASAKLRFVVSDDPLHFQAVARRLLGDPVNSVEQVTFT